MQRIGREVYLIIILVMLFVFGGLGLRAMQAKNEKPAVKRADASFAALRYPYSQLNEREQALYDALYDGISAYRETIRLPGSYTRTEYERVYLMVMMQEPELFYVDRVYELAAEMTEARIYYTMTQAEAEGLKSSLEAAADAIIGRLSTAQNAWQRLLMIHDAIAARCIYERSGHSDDAVGSLVEGYAMCEGYSKGFLYTARRAGYDIMCVPGHTGNGTEHVWNIVKIDGQYYNMDLTFDDDDSYGGAAAHACFAVPDAAFGDHLPDVNSYRPPQCTDGTQTYYIKNALILNETSQLSQRIQEWSGRRADGITEFCCGEMVADAKNSVTAAAEGTGQRVYWDSVRRIAVLVR